MRKLIILFVIFPFLLTGCGKSETINIAPDEYSISFEHGVGERTFAEVRDAESVEGISSILSGEFKLKKEEEDLEKLILTITPIYKGRTLEEMDQYAPNAYPEGESDGFKWETIYGEGIDVLSDREIAIWDAENSQYRIYKKTEKMDLSFLKSFDASTSIP